MATFTTTCGYCHSWCCSLRLSHGVSASTNFFLVFPLQLKKLVYECEPCQTWWKFRDGSINELFLGRRGQERKHYLDKALVSWMLHLFVHLYWHLYHSFWGMLLHMALMGTHVNAAEAIGVFTNVSPVIHMGVFGWYQWTVSHRIWTG